MEVAVIEVNIEAPALTALKLPEEVQVNEDKIDAPDKMD